MGPKTRRRDITDYFTQIKNNKRPIRWFEVYSSDFLRDRVSFESEVDKRSESFAGMLRMLPILPAISQRVGPASMNDANARDWNPLREESSWATEEDVHWFSKNRSLAIE